MKMQVPLGKPQPWVLPVTFVCLALGALIASMMRMATAATTQIDPNARPEELRAMISSLQQENNQLKAENQDMRTQKDKMLEAVSSDKKSIQVFMSEMNNLRMLAGTIPVEGRGVVITIDDTNNPSRDLAKLGEPALTHDVDLLILVNELRASGAEAIAINDQRVVNTTPIRCVGPVISVNNHQISTPFVIKAIGKPDVLLGAMKLPFGELDQLKQFGIQADVAKRDNIRLPAIIGVSPFEECKKAPDTAPAGTDQP